MKQADQPFWVHAALAHYPNRTVAFGAMLLAFAVTAFGAVAGLMLEQSLLLLTLFFGLGAWHHMAIQWMDNARAWAPSHHDGGTPVRVTVRR